MTAVTRGATALAVALSGIALPVLAASTAAAAATEAYQVPRSGNFQLSGLGFGHGIGMSQFGAEGMGQLGKNYRQILNFYYPGTNFADVSASRTIKVSLSGVQRQDFGHTTVLVKPRTGLRVVNDGRTIDLPTRVSGGNVTGYRVVRTSSSLQVRAYDGSKSERVAAGLKGTVRFATAAKQGNSRVTVIAASGTSRTYRGFLDVRRNDSGLLSMSNVLLEHYLRSVVSAEVPSDWTAAALRAQAVAARSYSLLAQYNARASGRAYDICDTSYCQVYGPVRSETAAEVRAVRATAGIYLKSEGQPVFAQFSSANGGYSVAGSRPYLVAQPDPYDGVVTGSANWGHSWEKTVSASSIERAWPQIGSLKTLKVLARDGNGQWGGRVLSVALVGSKATVSVSGDSFRWGLGLKSSWWTVTNVSSDTKVAPRKVRSDSMDRAVKVRWGEPNTDKRIRGYRITVKPGGHTTRAGAKDRVVKVSGLTNGRQYRAKVRAVYGGGVGPAGSTPAFVPTSSYSYYEPLSAARLVDGAETTSLASGGTRNVQVVGKGTAPPSGTRAVVLRVSAQSATRAGRVFVWPKDARDRKMVATTYGSGTGSTGLVTVPVNGTGRISVGATTKVGSLSVDLLGYYTSSGVGTKSLRAVAARRVVSSTTGLAWQGRKLAAGDPVSVRLAGRGGVPDGVRTVLVNLGLVHPSDNAALSVSAPGSPPSLGVAVRAPARQLRAGTTVARLDSDGRLWLRLTEGRSDVTVDVLGWFRKQDGSRTGRFRSVKATTVLSAGVDGVVEAGDARKVRVRGGSTGVPGAASSVVLQAVARGPGGAGSLSVTPAGSSVTPRPLVAYGSRGTERNLVVVPVGADGSVRVSAAQADVDVSLQVVGWYS